MTQQVINVGSSPNDSTGDPIRTAFQKINTNFNEIYANVVGSNFKFQVNTMTTKLGNVNISPIGANAVVVGINNQLFVSNSAAASDEYTGALVVAGGVGIGGNLYIGGTLNVPAASFSNLDDTIIGATVPTAGTFTEINADNLTVINNVTGSNVITSTIYVSTLADILTVNATTVSTTDLIANIISVQDTIFANTAVIDNVQIIGGNISGVSISILSIEDTAVGSITPNTGAFTIMTTSNAQITGGDISGVNLVISSLNNAPVGNATPSTGAFTTLTATTQYDGATFGPHNGTVGATTANTGNFTTLTATTQYDGAVFGPFNGTVGATTANTGNFTTLTATTQYDGAVFGPFNGTIGISTPNTGAFTTLTSSSTTSFNTPTAVELTAGTIGNTGATIIGNINGTIWGPINGVIGATIANTGTFTSISTSNDSTIGANLTISGNLIATAFDIQGNITGSAASASSATTAGSATYASTAGLATAATTVVNAYQGNITGVGMLDNLQVSGTSFFNDDITVTADITSNGYTSLANLTAIDCSVSNLEVFGGNLIIANNNTISTSIGYTGDFKGKITWDSNYIYVCTADYDGVSSVWVRANLSTF